MRLSRVNVVCGCAFMLLSLSSLPASAREKKPDRTISAALRKKILGAVVEVLIPKKEDANFTYERPLPFDMLPFSVRNDPYTSIGTAFFVGPNRLVSASHVFGLTYNHFNPEFFIRTASGAVFPVKEILKDDNFRDFVEFTVTGAINHQTFEKFAQATVGDSVCAPGNAYGEGLAVRCGGEVASFQPEPHAGSWQNIRFSTPVNPGNSGGPLLDSRGNVLGVVVQANVEGNYNVAIPIALWQKARPNMAEYFIPDFDVREDTGAVTRGSWEFKTPLPLAPAELQKEATKSYVSTYRKIVEKHQSEQKQNIFPDQPSLRTSLWDQNVDYETVAMITPTRSGAGLWSYSPPYRGESGRLENEEVTPECVGNLCFLLLPKKAGEPLLDFLKASKAHLDSYLKLVPQSRRIANDSVRITSMGEPTVQRPFVDELGRTWWQSIWQSTTLYQSIHQLCLPVPMGALCMVKPVGEWESEALHQLHIDDELRQMVNSYSGTSEEWGEFLKMSRDFIPPFLQNMTLEKKSDGLVLGGSLGKITLPLSTAKDRDSLTLRLGFNPRERISLAPMLIRYVPSLSEDARYVEIDKVFSIGDGHSKENVNASKKMFSQMAPYNGKPIQTEEFWKTRRFVPGSSALQPAEGLLVKCFSPISDSSETASAWCAKVRL